MRDGQLVFATADESRQLAAMAVECLVPPARIVIPGVQAIHVQACALFKVIADGLDHRSCRDTHASRIEESAFAGHEELLLANAAPVCVRVTVEQRLARQWRRFRAQRARRQAEYGCRICHRANRLAPVHGHRHPPGMLPTHSSGNDAASALSGSVAFPVARDQEINTDQQHYDLELHATRREAFRRREAPAWPAHHSSNREFGWHVAQIVA